MRRLQAGMLTPAFLRHGQRYPGRGQRSRECDHEHSFSLSCVLDYAEARKQGAENSHALGMAISGPQDLVHHHEPSRIRQSWSFPTPISSQAFSLHKGYTR